GSGRGVKLPLDVQAEIWAALTSDGRRVLTAPRVAAFMGLGFGGQGTLGTWDAATRESLGGEPKAPLKAPPGPAFFSPPGRRPLLACNGADWQVFDAHAGTPIAFLMQYEGGSGARPVFSPDGARVLLPAGTGPGRAGVRAWDLTSGQMGHLFPLRAEALATFS